VFRLPFRAAALFAVTLAANVVVMGWGNLHLIFADLSHPAEFRVSTPALAAVYVFILCLLALVLAVLLLAVQVLPRPVRAVAIGAVYAGWWVLSAFAISGLMVTEDMGNTWAPHEPFWELFFHPVVTPALLFASLALVLRQSSAFSGPRP
jgi:hypothetical protein